MASFFEFIEEDIEAKRTLITTLPTNNNRDIKKHNVKVEEIIKKYAEYKSSVKKYIDVKSKSFNVKENNKVIDEMNNKINDLEHARFILNPFNTYFEKMGFDNLLYDISNYNDFDFKYLNEIISQFIEKFKLVGIELSKDDFDCTCYVHKYMKTFFENRMNGNNNYDIVLEQFEKIYWINPELVGHIEVNFRQLIDKYEKKFINYISKLEKEVLESNKIKNYEECLEMLKKIYSDSNNINKESITDIIDLAKKGEIDINSYFENSKIRTTAYNSLSIESLNFSDKGEMSKFYETISKLKQNLEEYQNYMKFLPIIDDFKDEYQKELVSDNEVNKSNIQKKIKTIYSEIDSKKSKIIKLNKEIISKSRHIDETKSFEPGKTLLSVIVGKIESKNSEHLKQIKSDSIKLAQELYLLYKEYDREYINCKVFSVLNRAFTVSELLQLYYSFDYYKKIAIKKVFEITDYNKVNEYGEEFDLFAMDLNNVIIKGVSIFEENNIARVIVNKYRLDNINITEEELTPESIGLVLDKVNLLLRINVIENSSTSVEKIWFMTQVEKLNKKDNKSE